MKDNITENTVEIDVKDFGPIAEAKIELRPLTVFVGPSNTGKSYLATLIYALHHFFNDAGFNGNRMGDIPYYLKHRQRSAENYYTKNNLKKLLDWLKHVENEKVVNKNSEYFLPKEIFKLIRPCITNIDQRSSELDLEIQRCFSIRRTADLIRYQKKPGRKALVSVGKKFIKSDGKSTSVNYNISIGKQGAGLRTVVPGNPNSSTGLSCEKFCEIRKIRKAYSLTPNNDEMNQAYYAFILNQLANIFRSDVVGPLARSCYYLPANRTGIMHAHRVVVSSLVQRAARAGLPSEHAAPMLSGVMADFLDKLISLGGRNGRDSRKNSISDQIEQEILKGTIDIETSEIGYPEFYYQPADWSQIKLPLVNASSMISELAPVVLYLRHIVNAREVIIIEEPESHLHPAMEVEFTKQMTALVQSGVRVIITTHSSWILEKLANLVVFSDVGTSQRKEINGSDIALLPSQIGAWYFAPKQRPRGSIIREIKPDEESGIFPTDMDEVATDLYNEWSKFIAR